MKLFGIFGGGAEKPRIETAPNPEKEMETKKEKLINPEGQIREAINSAIESENGNIEELYEIIKKIDFALLNQENWPGFENGSADSQNTKAELKKFIDSLRNSEPKELSIEITLSDGLSKLWLRHEEGNVNISLSYNSEKEVAEKWNQANKAIEK